MVEPADVGDLLRLWCWAASLPDWRARLVLLRDAVAMADRPSGTVTFLFTDIEGSTELWEEYAAEMQVALEAHDAILRSAIDGRGGYVFSTAGDAFAAAFARAGDALAGAQSAQEALRSASWPTPAPIRVRMGLHTGEAQERDGDYFGSAVNRAARIMSAGHGDQVLVSSATVAVLGAEGLRELGEYRLKDLSASEHLYQLGDRMFPPLRTLDVVQHNLPVERTPLVGRKSDVEEITSLVEEHRLVTLLGIGGTGKTRLATAVAAEMADRFSDGVWFVDLVPVAGSEQVVEAIATAAGFSVS
ncbi:MAG: adenylate/guanylate cyclase domain-containing protein, partial [bacterium]|nr:adenylate/guanylate cyclase domain-containing protein [bacterium]